MSEDIVGSWWTGNEVRLPPEAELNETLRWLISQLNLGFFDSIRNEQGQTTTVVIGEMAAQESAGADATQRWTGRNFALNFARVLAAAREKGIEPEHVEMADRMRFVADENGYMNTEFHYALELMTILKGIRRRTFELTNLPLIGHASPELVTLLQEATRSHLFGLHTALQHREGRRSPRRRSKAGARSAEWQSHPG